MCLVVANGGHRLAGENRRGYGEEAGKEKSFKSCRGR